MHEPIPLVDLQAQYATIQDEINEAIQRVISSSAFIKGPYVKKFEEEFAAFCGRKKDGRYSEPLYCAGCANGTDALFLAAWALGIGDGDEVIVPTHTFIGSTEGISHLGAKVVFCDIDPETYLIDTKSLEQMITPKTKAVVAVHLYGQPCNMGEICRIASDHNLFVIEDAAQAHGAYWKNDRVGSIGDIACFSFFPGKNLGAYGDAGGVVSKHKKLIESVRQIANHGRLEKYEHAFEGINSRLDGLQAAILSVKLQYLTEWTARRNEIANRYSQLLRSSHVTTPKVDSHAYSAWHLYVVRVQNRDNVLDELRSQNIFAGVHYPIPLHMQPAYANEENTFPNAEQVSEEILSLPMFPELQMEQIGRVASALIEATEICQSSR